MSKIKDGLFGLTTKWSPDGSRLLLSSAPANNQSMVLSVNDSQGNEIFKTNLFTWPDKCVWADNQEIYCAIPLNVSANDLLPDQYLSGEINTRDQIVLINIKDKKIYGVFNDKLFDISQLSINSGKNYLAFIDRLTGYLWSLKLR